MSALPQQDWTRALADAGQDPNRALLAMPDFDLPEALGGGGAWQVEDHGAGNLVCLLPGARVGPVTFAPASRDCILLCGTQQPSRQPVVFAGQGHRVILGPGKKFSARIAIAGRNNLFFAGAGTTCNQANIVLQGLSRSIILGRDGMLSFDVTLRAADSHALVDLADMAVVNPPRSILIGAHVWLGEGATVLKGVRIGRGSVVAAAALVVSDLPETSLALGVPARVVRDNMSWTRQPEPDPAELDALRRMLGGPAPSGAE